MCLSAGRCFLRQATLVVAAVAACWTPLLGGAKQLAAQMADEMADETPPVASSEDTADENTADENTSDADARQADAPQQQATSAEPAAPSGPTTVLTGLTNPCGVVVQPSTGHVFVADSGAGRIVRVVEGAARDVVTGFPADTYGEGPKYRIGPLGLGFLDQNTLVVAGGGLADGSELVRIYEVPAADAEPITADNTSTVLGPLVAEGETPGEGNFYGVALIDKTIYVTANGDDTKGWIARAVKDSEWSPLERFLATKPLVERDAPVAITTSPRGELVVGQMGEITSETDSLLTFYGARTKRLLLNLETGLRDITALAYSPKTGYLYALDFAWADPAQGGLYRLDDHRVDGHRACNAVKIHPFTRPAAMVFAPSGELYVTTFGQTEGQAEPTGELVRIPPGL